MKVFILMILMTLFGNSSLKADSVNIEVEPRNPLKGESFKVIFKINTNETEDPYISFNPGGADVLGKSNSGVSISTTIINGKIRTKREMSVVYELLSSKAGTVRLSDIKIEVGSKTFKADDITFRVLSKQMRPKNFFVIAIPSKNSVYVGEGIDVDYFLYYKVPVVAHEIAEFPKLNNFIKRFHIPNEQPQTVQYNGLVYQRSKKYSARVYPEKTGKLIIDPLKLKVQYSSRSRKSPFGGFGFSLGQYMVKTTSSQKVEIDVKALPVNNVPSNFIGLIGEHQFSLEVPRQKYLVNEAIELKLTVLGPGALENLDAPKLLNDPNLETFDTKGEMAEVGNSSARKIFEYTYLARGSTTIPEKNIELAYYDPMTESYKTKSLKIPEITVSGGQVSNAKPSLNPVSNEVAPIKDNITLKKSSLGLVAPDFEPNFMTIFLNEFINIVLSLGIIALLVSMFLGREIRDQHEKELLKLCHHIKKVGTQYSLAFKLINFINQDKKESSLNKIIEKSELSDEAKRYFADFVDLSEGTSYGHDEKSSNFNYNAEYFKELQKVAKKINSESRVS